MKQLSLFLSLGCALLFTATASGSSLCDSISGNLVLNCGFELPYPGGDGSVPTDWTGAQFTPFEDVVTTPVNSGNESMRISNDEGQVGDPLFDGAAIMSQSFTDTLGEQYTFDFYLYNADQNGADEQFQAFWGPSANPTGGTPVFVDTGAAPSSWVQQSFTVVGTGSDTITFTAFSSPSFYFLDDVSLVDTGVGAATTPEPATLAMLAAGLFCMGVRRRAALSHAASVASRL